MGRQGLFDDAGYNFDWECSGNIEQCKNCVENDSCSMLADMLSNVDKIKSEW